MDNLKQMKQAERIFSIISLCLTREENVIFSQEIADKYGCSRRTAIRDIRFLLKQAQEVNPFLKIERETRIVQYKEETGVKITNQLEQ